MKRIAWITPSSFVDVDLPIISELQNKMIIYWQIVIYGSLSDDMKSFIDYYLKESKNVHLEYVEIPYRVYDLRTLYIYCKILRKAKTSKPDLYYTSLDTAPFGPIVYRCFWPIKKVVTACHNVSTPKGANREKYARFYTNLTLRAFSNIQVFSEAQRDILLQNYPNKNILLAPLAVKDYGNPTTPHKLFNENSIVFLFFGIIAPYKRLDLLIEAAQTLYEQGYRNFSVKIAGGCKAWYEYETLIKYPDLFDTRIERIPNSEVANLFASCDYFVMPYQDIAQSGAITVAYRYNLPIILSDLPQFRPFVDEGKTGYFFKANDVNELIKCMKYVMDGGKQLHESLCEGLKAFVQERYSTPAIADKYYVFFNELHKD